MPGRHRSLPTAGVAVAHCEIDHAVPPVSLVSGLAAARARLADFCADGLRDYAARRTDQSI